MVISLATQELNKIKKSAMKKFNGVVKLDVRDSKQDWGPYEQPRAPKGAPNILIVLYDDNHVSIDGILKF